jgi:hypothetical protein
VRTDYERTGRADNGGQEGVRLDVREIGILGAGVERHWYFRSKAAAVGRLLGTLDPGVILDVGAGSGYFSRRLLEATSAQEAWCIDSAYEGDSDDEVEGKPLRYRREPVDAPADLVVMMDVLEHVEDDLGFLRDWVARAQAGARFLVTVPAFQVLWSGHDEFLGHKRRYTLRELEARVSAAGLEIDRSAYFFAAVLPIAAGMRLAGKLWSRQDGHRSHLRSHHGLTNALLESVCRAELALMRLNRAAGLTAMCLARKPITA